MVIGEGQDWHDGVGHAWNILSSLSPESVCRKTKAGFDASAGHYILPLFNERVYVSTGQRRLWSGPGVAGFVLNELPHLATLAVLWYLIQAKDIPLSGTLVNPREVSGGLIFALGSHTLPFDRLVAEYGRNVAAFLEKGVSLGGERLNHGDAAIRLFPFPMVPVTLLMWQEDEEFPARADILFDATCSEHLPTDIIWSTAMIVVLTML